MTLKDLGYSLNEEDLLNKLTDLQKQREENRKIFPKEENVNLDMLIGHGGFFKTPVVGQRLMAAAAGVPVAVMETAGEGGAWGAALLAGYRVWKDENESLNDYLAKKVFSGQKSSVIEPKTEEQEEFTSFMNTFRSGLAIERAAIEHL